MTQAAFWYQHPMKKHHTWIYIIYTYRIWCLCTCDHNLLLQCIWKFTRFTSHTTNPNLGGTITITNHTKGRRSTMVVFWVSAHGCLNIHETLQFQQAWVLTWDINCMYLYGSCYIDPLKFGTWELSEEWALAQDTIALFTLANLARYGFNMGLSCAWFHL